MARKLTTDMYDLLMMDLPLRPAMIVDFGLDNNGSPKHSALQRAVRAGATVEELDAVLGNGKEITTLVEKYTETAATFVTPYDIIRGEVKRQIDELEAKEVLTDKEREDLNSLYEDYKDL
jgi:hypothetical protein